MPQRDLNYQPVGWEHHSLAIITVPQHIPQNKPRSLSTAKDQGDPPSTEVTGMATMN